MTLKSSEVQDYSWNISTVLVSFLVSSSSFHGFLPLTVRPMMTTREMFLKIFFDSPAFHCSIIFSKHMLSMTKKIDQFLRYFIIGEWIFFGFNIGPTSFPNGYSFCGWVGRFSSLWFCFGLWSACKILENCLCSWTRFWSQLHIYLVGNRLLLQIRVEFWCSLGSNLLVQMLLRLLVERTYDRPLHLWIVRILQCLTSWNTVRFQHASIQILLSLPCCDSFKNSLSICLQQKIFVSQVITIQKYFCLDHAWHEWGTRLPSHNGLPRSIVKGFVFFTHLCDCSVKTELIYRINCAKTVLIVFKSAQ